MNTEQMNKKTHITYSYTVPPLAIGIEEENKQMRKIAVAADDNLNLS